MRVALSGYYGFGNHGDEALLAGLVAGLRVRDHEPLVLSADPEATRALHGVEARSRTRGLPTALLSVDAVVSGGGGLLQDVTSGRSLVYYLATVRLARILGKRTIVYGQSVGPLSPRGRTWVRYALAGVPVSVRDAPSERLLAELGIASARTADAALLAPAAAPSHGAESGGRDPDARASFPSYAGPSSASAPEPTVLVPRAGYPAHTAALSSVAVRLRADGAPVRVVAFHPGPDASEARAIQDAAAGASVHVPSTWWEARQLVATARAVASTRLHALIFAAGAGVPHAGLVYDPKVEGFLRESRGLALHDPIDVDALHRALVEPTQPPADARDRLVARAEGGLDWLDAALRRAT